MGIKKSPAKRSPIVIPKAPPDTIAASLFSRTQQRVLGLLFGQPERSYFATELISLAGAGSGSVQRELQKLLSAGLITSREVGRQRYFQANPASPIFHELCQLMLKTVGIATPLRAALGQVRKPIDLALIYGSIAKGEATAQSDIDLLVVADDLDLESLFRAIEPAEKQLGRKINPNLLSVAEFKRRRNDQNPFLTRVLAGPTIPLIGDLNAL
jgi:predicted nucleotidyltransferase